MDRMECGRSSRKPQHTTCTHTASSTKYYLVVLTLVVQRTAAPEMHYNIHLNTL